MNDQISTSTKPQHVKSHIAEANSWFRRRNRGLLASTGLAAFLLVSAPALAAATAPPLGAVQSFAVLGGASVTATPPAGTVIDGDVGSAPTPTVNGFGPAVVTAGFTVYTVADAATANARTAAGTAFGNLAGQVCPAGLPNHIAGGILDGLNLGPGVYCMPTGSLTGTLTLTGGPTDVWVFQMTTDTLTTAAASKVVMAGGASACNVYWQISTSATLGGGASEFSGSIFSGVSIGLGATAKVIGRAVAGSGTVTMDGSNTVGGCSAAADLAITKTDGVASVNAGGSTSYTITVTNNGPSSVTAAILSDAAAAGLSKTAVACSGGTPGQCVTAPTVAQLESGTFALPALASGQTYQITVTANITAISGSVSNTATVAVPAGTTDSNPANNSATDTDTVNAVADLVITKTDGVASVNAGGSTSYTITVTNNGPSSVTGAILSDAVVAGLSKTAVACSGTPGQCAAAPTVAQLQSGTFPLTALASGQTYQITVTANVTAISGSVSNNATVAVPAGTTDSNPANNSATDTDTVNSTTITVTKISNGGIGSFSFTGDNGFANQTIATLVSGVGVAGAMQTLTAAGAITTITESAPPAGFVLASISCSGLGVVGTATPNIVARNVVLNAAATAGGAAIACTFTNVAVVPNSITIVKSTLGGNGTFAYTGTNGIAGFNITTASGSGSNAITALAVGSYTINETPVPVGWSLTNLQCLGAATPVAITGGQAVITLAVGEAVVCTYTNTKHGSITINKTAVGGDSTFNYTGAQSFSITTAGGNGSNTTAFASVVPGTYNVTETVPVGWNLTGLTCSNGSTVTVGTATANVAVAAGEAVTCTFTNNLLPIPAAGIPTLSEWVMIMLAAFLAITGFAAMRRQAR